MIYLDNAATTKPLADLQALYGDYCEKLWYNPSALYKDGTNVNTLLNQAREDLLKAGGFNGHLCVFNSGGTEGANTVILRGTAKNKHSNYVCALGEHPCVEESYKQLEQSGAEVRYAKTDKNGYIDSIAHLVDENTALVSVMQVNNETGAKNDITALSAEVKRKNPKTLFHSDGVQGFLREKIANTQNIDYYTVSAHKLHAFKGTGAVFYKKGSPLKAYAIGGGQENALRSGTQNTLGILAFKVACNFFNGDDDGIKQRLSALKSVFMNTCSHLDDAILITPSEEEKSCNHIVNLSILGINGETLMHILEEENIYISTGSACSSKKGKSRMAKTLNLTEEVAQGSIRVSFSPFNKTKEVEFVAQKIIEHTKKLRKYFKK